MNLMEKYRSKFESTVKQRTQIMTPDVTNALPEEVKETYEERSAVLEYDGGLDPEEAERQVWCQTGCMLSFPSQWRECERFKPKPCLKLMKHTFEDSEVKNLVTLTETEKGINEIGGDVVPQDDRGEGKRANGGSLRI